MTISSAASAPTMRPVLARTSSAASGLRFCGMIEEPVVKRSESSNRPQSGEHQITISSAKRERCTAVMAAAPSTSKTKSRSETAAGELAIGRERVVDRVDRPPDPESEVGRHLVVARARGVQPPGRGPDQLGEPALNVHMDVLERPLEAELAALDL